MKTQLFLWLLASLTDCVSNKIKRGYFDGIKGYQYPKKMRQKWGNFSVYKLLKLNGNLPNGDNFTIL